MECPSSRVRGHRKCQSSYVRRSCDFFFEKTLVISALDVNLSRKAEVLDDWCKEDWSENRHLSEDDFVGALLQ